MQFSYTAQRSARRGPEVVQSIKDLDHFVDNKVLLHILVEFAGLQEIDADRPFKIAWIHDHPRPRPFLLEWPAGPAQTITMGIDKADPSPFSMSCFIMLYRALTFPCLLRHDVGMPAPICF